MATVKVNCMVVPDGMTLRRDTPDGPATAALLRVSLVLVPEFTNDPGAFALEDWVVEVSRRQFKLTFRDVDGLEAGHAAIILTDPAFGRGMAAASTLWRGIFPAADHVELQRLLTRPVKVADGAIAVGGKVWDARQVYSDRASVVASAVDKVVESDTERSMARALVVSDTAFKSAIEQGLASARDATMQAAGAAFAEQASLATNPQAGLQAWLGRRGAALGQRTVTDAARRLEAAASAGAPDAAKALAVDEAALANQGFIDDLLAELRATSPAGGAKPLDNYQPSPGVRSVTSTTGWKADLRDMLELSPDVVVTRTDESVGVSAFDRATAPDPMVRPDNWSPGNPEEWDQPDPDLAGNAIARKLAGLEAYPTVRKFLRLIADLTIELRRDAPGGFHVDGDRWYGGLGAVDTLAPDVGGQTTMFVVDWEEGVFEPCPSSELKAVVGQSTSSTLMAQAFPLRDGALQMRTPGRFKLTSLDIPAGRRGFRQAADHVREAHQNGVALANIETGLPDIRTRGLVLLDTSAAHTQIAQIVRASVKTSTDPLFAEDMISGFRVNIIRHREGSPLSVLNATARDVVHPEVLRGLGLRVPQDLEAERPPHPYPGFQGRDDGFVAAMARVREAKDESGKELTEQFAGEEMFAFNGDPLALPHNDEAHPGTYPRAPGEVETIFLLPKGRRLPVYRVGLGALVLLTVRKPNGASSEAMAHLIASSALGSGDGDPGTTDTPFVLTRSERTSAPDLLYRRSDTERVGGKHLLKEGNRGVGDNIDTLILKPSTGRRKVSRVALAPRTDFTTVEQDGGFDQARTSRDPSMLGVYRRLDLDGGGQPHAAQSPHTTAPGGTAAAGGVFATQAPTPSIRPRPWFVERGAQHLGFRLLAGARPVDDDEGERLVSFWAGRPTDDAVKPVLLDLLPAEAGQPRVSIATAPLTDGGGTFQDSPCITVRLGEAEEVKLEMWTYPGLDDALNTRRQVRNTLVSGLRKMQGIAVGLGNDGKALDEAAAVIASLDVAGSRSAVDGVDDLVAAQEGYRARWRTALSRSPVEGFTSVRTMKLVHAVPRALEPPQPSGEGLRFVRLGPESAKDWPGYVGSAGSPARWRSERGGSHLFVAGELSFDRKSTDLVRCDIAWLEHGDPAVSQAAGDGLPTPDRYDPTDPAGPYRYRPACEVQPLFTDISKIARQDDRPNLATRLSLLLDDDAQLRGLLAPIKDTKAHRAAVRFVGISRYVDYFGAGPATDLEGRHGAATATTASIRSLVEDTGAEDAGTFWINSTQRPERLEAVSVGYIFPQVEETRRPGVVEVTYRPSLRVGLGKKAFTSGDGELIALLYRPLGLVPDVAPSPARARPGRYGIIPTTPAEGPGRAGPILTSTPPGALDEPAWLAPFLTRWGASPDRRSAPLEPYFAPPSIFGGHVASVGRLRLPRNVAKDPTTDPNALVEGEDVSILAFEPSWDADHGSWFIDIDVETYKTHSPMVRLGLARYQPHSVEGLDVELSEPIAAPEIEVPSAWRVKVMRGADAITVEVRGDSYSQRAPAMMDLAPGVDPITEEDLRRLQTPNLKIEIALAGADGRSGVADYDPQGRRLEAVVTGPVDDGASNLWAHTFQLDGLAGDRVVTISEIIMDVDHLAGDPDATGSPFVVRQRPFAVTLAI